MAREHEKILLAFDFGMKKIGVAVGQTVTRTANALLELKAQDGIPEWAIITELVNTWKADAFIVGLPLNMDGTEQEMTLSAKKFGRRLHHRYLKPVYFVDERLTTVEARSLIGHASSTVDRWAAKLILETWFREHTHE